MLLTPKRWQQELVMMAGNFPEFRPFAEPPWFGFQGFLIGPRTGRRYEVAIEGDERAYPLLKPAVYINPPIGPYCEFYGWSGRSRGPQLSIDVLDWRPARSSFAIMLVRVIGYLEKFDEPEYKPDDQTAAGRRHPEQSEQRISVRPSTGIVRCAAGGSSLPAGRK